MTWVFLFVLLFSPTVFAESFGEIKRLSLVSPAATGLINPVDVRFALDGDILIAEFDVRTPEINAKEVLGKGEYPYQKDVVELFVSVRGPDSKNIPYYEFELSPYNQMFQVLVRDFKKPFIGGVDLGVEHSVKRTDSGWIGEMRIPLKRLGWKGNPAMVVGNAFAILGKAPRSFWSLYLPKQTKPKFHLPKYFQPLLQNKGFTTGHGL